MIIPIAKFETMLVNDTILNHFIVHYIIGLQILLPYSEVWNFALIQLQIGVTGLHLAAKEGHVDVVSELVKHGARVDAATRVRAIILWTCLEFLVSSFFD